MRAVTRVALSDRALRRSAWAISWFLASMMALNALLSLDDRAKAAMDEGADEFVFFIVVMIFPLVGLLILRRQPRNTIGWLLQGIGLVWAVGAFTDSYATYGLLLNPGSVPQPAIAAVINGGIWVPALGLMCTFLILLYPDGHLPSPRWRLVGWLSAGTIVALTLTLYLTPGRLELGPAPTVVNPLGWESAQPVLAVAMAVLLALFPLCSVLCAASVVRRFRRSHGIERLQLKWLATAGAVVALLFLTAMAAPVVLRMIASSDTARPWLNAVDTLSFLSFALLPGAIGVAILRHGLYGIDVFINRALVYSFLTDPRRRISGVGADFPAPPSSGDPAVGAGCSCLDSGGRSTVRPSTRGDPARSRPPVLPQSLRRCPDGGRLRCPAATRGGP